MKRLDDDKLKFNEEKHEYRVGKKNLTPVTDWVSSFFQAFDEEVVSKKMSDKSGKPQEEILAEWEKSRNDGTAVHKEIENWINSRAQPTSEKAQQGVNALLLDLGFTGLDFSEVKVYSERLGLAGTIDFLQVEEGELTKPRVTLVDWKTNKEIRRSNPYQKTEGVVSHLHDCHLVKYALQLSTYAYILEQEYGFLVDTLYICHLTDKGYKMIPVDYLKQTVKEMVKNGKD